MQNHLRGIALHGYWGTANSKIGSLNKLKAEYKEIVLQYGKTSAEAKTLAKQIAV